MGTPANLDSERGIDDLALGPVGVAQITGERGRHLADRPAELLSEPGQNDRVLPGRDAGQEVAAPQLLKRVTQHLASHRVGIHETPLGIHDGDPLRGAGHHTRQRRQTQRSGLRERGGPSEIGTHSAGVIRSAAFPRLPTTAKHS
jgi:hypothetical protein